MENLEKEGTIKYLGNEIQRIEDALKNEHADRDDPYDVPTREEEIEKKNYVISDVGGEDSLLRWVYAIDELDAMRQAPGYKMVCVHHRQGRISVIEVIADDGPAKGGNNNV